jgi:GntR family hexuronate regulon transcriptional repressor
MSDRAADPTRLRQQIANAIAVSIRDGRWATGQRLPSERDLAEDYGVSRPTIREAMIILEARGLVEARHGAGVHVTDAPRSDASAPRQAVSAFELVEARRLIEGDACALAAATISDAQIQDLTVILNDMAEEHDFGALADLADRRFHVAIARASRNSVLATMIENLWDLRYQPACRDLLERAGRIRAKPLVNDHQEILDALKARDPAAARTAMREHLGRMIENLMAVVEADALEEARAEIRARRSEVARRASV